MIQRMTCASITSFCDVYRDVSSEHRQQGASSCHYGQHLRGADADGDSESGTLRPASSAP